MNSLRKGKPIGSQARTITLKLYTANLEKGKHLQMEYPQNYAIKETEKLTGISTSSVRRIVAEYTKEKVVKSPTKKVPHIHWRTGLDSFDIAAIRRIIYDFHKTEKVVITLKALRQRLLDDLQVNFSKTSLHRILRTNGFKFKKTENNRKVLCERTDIKIQRIKYIRQVQQYRETGYNIIYIDESYVHSSHTRPNVNPKSNISKGSRLIMAHGGGQTGFVKNGLLLFKSGCKTGDYHDEMNYGNFSKWLKQQILNNLEKSSVIVMDNATYHNEFDSQVPNSSSPKAEMIDWLDTNNIQHQPTMLKVELYDLVRQNKSIRRHQIDDIIHESGHKVLRLPPYHPDLNPIENIWGIVQNRIAARNTTFKLEDVKKITEEEIEKITVEDWQKVCEKITRIENEYSAHEVLWDQITERIIIHPSDDSSTETESDSDDVLLFPPVNNYRRFLIHRSCENYRQDYDLFTFSVGQGPHRRTVICFKSQLLDPIKFTAASSLETRKTTQVKSWRSGGEKIESATTSSLWSSPSSSTSSTLSTKTTKRDIAATTTTGSSSSSMGVEKHLDSSSSASARLNKSHSVDIYRPPALRRNLESIDNDNQQQQQVQQLQHQQQEHLQEQHQQPLQPNDTNCISAKSAASSNLSETIQSCCNGIDIAATPTTTTTATSTSSTSCSNQRQVRRERRPDRAVYVPRARRSQTTPPAVSTQPQAHLQPPHQQAIPVTEINNQLTSWTATSSLSSGTINTTTTTTITSTTGTCKSPSGEKSSGNNSRKSNKDRVSGNAGRKEKSSSSKRLSIDENEKTNNNPHKSNNSTNNHYSEEETAVSTGRKYRLDKQPIGSVSLNGLSNYNDKNALLVKDCDITNPKEFPDSTNLTNSKKSVNIVASDVRKQVLPKMMTTSPPTLVPDPFVPPEIPESVGNLRIEDVLVERSEKCDRDAEELLRASKEINRSNRRIIKQTFNSDVLEIPEKAVFDTNSVVKRTAKDDRKNVVSTMTSGTDEDELEEDDWDSMYDDSGDCLDPKILQELTASVGKVKIELPKMDYSAYLTKQSILNDEEFPHVLEVSNFPVEFKNQDLLMVFSQYKESGFDIKWVDDTHALAVFSSSQVAAEVLAMGHPFVVLKPLAEATVESRLKAKKCSASLQPYRPRPETCAALARRLVTGALGVRLKTAAQERENEKRVLREAKERKLLAAKQRDEAWES